LYTCVDYHIFSPQGKTSFQIWCEEVDIIDRNVRSQDQLSLGKTRPVFLSLQVLTWINGLMNSICVSRRKHHFFPHLNWRKWLKI